MLKGWNSEESVSDENLDRENAVVKGYYHSSHDDWDGKEWKRNFHEIRQRDLMIFALGDIKEKKVLDIGCGAADYLAAVGKMGAEFVGGQDLDKEAILRGKKRLDKENIKNQLIIGNATKLEFPNNYFDIVFSSDFFEHISTEVKEIVISEAYRVLKPGGSFIIKTPNLTFLKIVIILKRILNILRFRSPFIYVAHTRNNPDNEHFGLTTHSELSHLLESNFFHTPEIVHTPLVRKGLPKIITKLLYGRVAFSEAIILSAKKAVFYGFWK